MKVLSLDELRKLSKDSYVLIEIREINEEYMSRYRHDKQIK